LPRKKRQLAIGTIDCETDPFEPGLIVQPFIWGIYLWDGTYYEFGTVQEVVNFVADKQLVLYAHNGGKFDYHFLADYIESDEPISVIAGRVARFKIGKCEFRDSLNLFGQTKLADFSKKEIDYRKLRTDVREQHMPEIREYLRYDCESLFRLVSEFIENYGMQFTQAGAAMRYWKKKFAPHQFVPSSSGAFYDRFAPFYYGGRVQCFAAGHSRQAFKVVDINSAYPRAMLDRHAYDTSPITVSRLPKPELIAQSLIELDAVSKGALPLRAEDGSLFFPEDEKTARRYHITGWEYLAGMETGTLFPQKIHAVHLFGNPVDFGGYVKHFYQQRKDAKAAGDKAQDIFAKIFMNGLYGKFAANPTKYQEFVLSEPDSQAYEAWLAAGYEDQGEWGRRAMMIRPLPPSKHRYYNIVTGASITGWVRAFLWRSLLKVENPLYCDTDSIAASDVGDLDLGAELGQWKVEAECDEYAIFGKKGYAFHLKGKDRPLHVKRQMPLSATDAQRATWKEDLKCWKLACKGSDLTPQEIIRAATGETVTNFAQVPNYSIHRREVAFINRDVRRTYRDIRRMPA
jgi:Vibrio phage DNA polymerase